MRQRDPHAVASGQVLDRSREIGFSETQSGENAFGFMLRVQVSVRGIQHGVPGDGFQFLREIADAQSRAFADGAFVRRFLAKNHAKERRFSDAVRPDEPDAGAGRKCADASVKRTFEWQIVYDAIRFEASSLAGTRKDCRVVMRLQMILRRPIGGNVKLCKMDNLRMIRTTQA